MPPLAAIPQVLTFFATIVFGGAILLAVRILAEDEGRRSDRLHHTLRRVGWLLIIMGGGATLVVAGLVPSVVALVVFPAVVYRRRKGHRYALLAAMAVAVQRRIPLIPVLLAFASERRGYVARRAMELAAQLQAGLPLPDAIDSVPGLFPSNIRLALRMGHDTGELAKVLHDALERADAHDAIESQIFGQVMYFLLVSLVMLSILTFVMMKIVPAFQKIFEEFGVELPGMTLLLVKLSYMAVNSWYFAAPFFLIALAYALGSTLRYVGLVEREMWGLGVFRRRIHAAEILEVIAVFVRANRPLTEPLAGLAQWYPVARIRTRLARAYDEVNQGADWCDALARRRLITAGDRGVLAAAQRVGNLAWASEELADSNRRAFSTRATATVQTVFVVLLLIYGLFVAFFFIAMFLPLIKLISSLT